MGLIIKYEHVIGNSVINEYPIQLLGLKLFYGY